MPIFASPRPLVALSSLLLSACSSVVVRDGAGSAAALEGFTSYAWTSARAATAAEGASADEVALHRAIREAVDRRLAERGFRRAEAANAELLLEERTDIEVRSRQRDPYFSFYSVIQYELGTLTLDVLDRRTNAVLWSTSVAGPLRDVARGFGMVEVRFESLEETRDWKVEEKVSEIVARIPARGR